MEIKTIIFWVLLIAMAVPSFYFGVTKLIKQKGKVDLFQRFGYPVWFMMLIGLGEVTAAIGLLFLQTRMIAIGILAIIFVGAIFSHLRAKDDTKKVMSPFLVLTHLVIIFVFTLL